MAKHSTARSSGSTKHDGPRDHYAAVTEQVITALEAGTLPWRKPWDPDKAGGLGMPRNAVTGARYRGVNTVVLGMSPLAFGNGDPRWATYKQAYERGWQVRKGERSTTAYFFKRVEVRDGTDVAGGEDATRRIPLLRAFCLFTLAKSTGCRTTCRPRWRKRPGARRKRPGSSSPTAVR